MMPTKHAVTATAREAIRNDAHTREAVIEVVRHALQHDLETRGIVKYVAAVNTRDDIREIAREISREEIVNRMDPDLAKRAVGAVGRPIDRERLCSCMNWISTDVEGVGRVTIARDWRRRVMTDLERDALHAIHRTTGKMIEEIEGRNPDG